MFHLFKKVYIDFDDKISMSYDRIVCSEQHGDLPDATELTRVFNGENLATVKSLSDLIGKGKKFESLLEMLQLLDRRVDTYDRKVFIFCDRESYYKLAIQWMKIITPNCDKDNAWKFFKSHIFKEKNFTNSRFSAAERFSTESESWMLMEDEFKQYWDDVKVTRAQRVKFTEFLEHVVTGMRIEFLLAGYFYDGRYSEEFAKAITPLVKKDLEKFLYEHKEIILVHFLRPKFQELLQVQNGPYTFDNFYDMVDDPAPMVKVMFKPEIWGEARSSMFAPTSAGTINMSAITDEDIETIKQYSLVTGTVWSDEQWYTVVRSEIDKFNFIKMFRDKQYLTVDDLKEILDYELHHQSHSAGVFYSIDLRTVNTYFVDYMLQNKDNKGITKPFAFEITY
jgi:hypothetical protein